MTAVDCSVRAAEEPTAEAVGLEMVVVQVVAATEERMVAGAVA